MKINKIFLVWLFLVALWNFGVPHATPIFDVLAAVALYLLVRLLERTKK
tara:strand:+ start:198 stop:344 length:147 start_codon:yes stop_codon:yes gene_type:complete